MDQIYYNPTHAASYGGINRLAQALSSRNKKKNVSKRKVQEWLGTQRPYTLHRPARRHFPVRRTRTSEFAMQFQADLNDMIAHGRVNRGYRYILTVIDVFSRYAWALPLKSKTGQELVRAFEKIFNGTTTTRGAIPHYLQTDQGKEFENRPFQNFLKRHGVTHFSVKSPFKASLVERFNRTLKARMFRYFTREGSYKWLSVLPQLVSSYNLSHHRALPKGMTPEQASQSVNHHLVWLHQEDEEEEEEKGSCFSVGDKVRISKWKRTFEKGYLPDRTEEIFTIVRIDRRYAPLMYTVKDEMEEEIEGKFYGLELQKVSNPDGLYAIEKIIRRKKSRCLVKFLGYPGQFWVDELRKL